MMQPFDGRRAAQKLHEEKDGMQTSGCHCFRIGEMDICDRYKNKVIRSLWIKICVAESYRYLRKTRSEKLYRSAWVEQSISDLFKNLFMIQRVFL